MKNNRGFSLPEMLVYIGIASIVMLVGASILILSSRMKSQVNTYVGIAEAMNQVQAILKDDAAFKATVMDPTNLNLSCLKQILGSDGTGAGNATGSAADCRGKGGTFTLYTYDSVNKVNIWAQAAARANVSTDGLDMNGAYCNGYGKAPQIKCPFRIALSWTAICSTNPCPNPVIQLSANLLTDFGPSGPPKDFHLASNAFRFSMNRQTFSSQDAQSCQSIGGSWNKDTGLCSRKYYGVCLSGEYLVGFDSDGRVKCRKFDKGKQCPRGQTFGGFNTAGLMVCNSGCQVSGGTTINPWGDIIIR